MAWRVLVPIKQSAVAKSRLLGATSSPAEHAELVHAMQLDTLDAVLAVLTHPLVSGLAVVAEQLSVSLPAGIERLPDAGGGLNPALARAAAELSRRHPGDGTVALVGDLPALRPADLLQALGQAGRYERSFVRDLAGTGTTLLAASAGVTLDPRFGPDSARRHAESGAVELAAAVSLRSDVDSPEDLRQVLQLGAGLLTAQLRLRTPLS
ncbi:MAG TPA: 2-phospho-L-lactate guanylyltransferase [Jatrophihabitans sp.]|nr:2-phospho-L-lactate guanylyltransferase [Jatrophihabitans sp.]